MCFSLYLSLDLTVCSICIHMHFCMWIQSLIDTKIRENHMITLRYSVICLAVVVLLDQSGPHRRGGQAPALASAPDWRHVSFDSFGAAVVLGQGGQTQHFVTTACRCILEGSGPTTHNVLQRMLKFST